MRKCMCPLPISAICVADSTDRSVLHLLIRTECGHAELPCPMQKAWQVSSARLIDIVYRLVLARPPSNPLIFQYTVRAHLRVQ